MEIATLMINLEANASFRCQIFRCIAVVFVGAYNGQTQHLSSCLSTTPPHCPGGWPTCSKGLAPNDPMGTDKEALDGVQCALAPACVFSVAR